MKTKNIYKIVWLYFLTAVVISCNNPQEIISLSGVTVTSSLSVSEFNSLNVHKGIAVIIHDTIKTPFVQTDAALMKFFIANANGSHLLLSYDDNLLWESEFTTRVYLPASLDSISDLHLHGGSSLAAGKPITCDNLTLELTGASLLDAELRAANTNLTLSGGSSMKVNGTMGHCMMKVSGASLVTSTMQDDRYALSVSDLAGTISGESRMFVHSDGKIAVTLSGASSLYYTGDANTAESTTSGMSIIEKK